MCPERTLGCLAGDAVLIAAVSRQFPANREFYRETDDYAGPCVRFRSIKTWWCSDLRSNSLLKLSGKLIFKNRVSISKNRETLSKVVSVHFSHTCLVRLRSRSVLTDNFAGGGRDFYAIEGSIRGRTAEARRRVRNASAWPLIQLMKPWLKMDLGRVPPGRPPHRGYPLHLGRWAAHPLPR